MLCRKCKEELPDGAAFCPCCGMKQTAPTQKRKQRGNGQGSVYKLPNGSWRAVITLGYTDEGKRVCRTKSGFKTKKEALDCIPQLWNAPAAIDNSITWIKLYDKWRVAHEKDVSKSVMGVYQTSMNHFKPIYFMKIRDIKTSHLQDCVDKCDKASVKSKMKILAGLLFKYAMQQDLADKNYAQFIHAPASQAAERQVFTPEQIEIISKNVGKITCADAILILIYTGFRANEFLSLKKSDFDPKARTLTGGSKTEAGKNRIIPVSTKILPLVEKLAKSNPNCIYLYSGKAGQKIDYTNFRRWYYYPALKEMGLPAISPHCCRHTFATLIKKIEAPTTDKQKLMGHTSFHMTAHYTHTSSDDLKKIIDEI